MIADVVLHAHVRSRAHLQRIAPDRFEAIRHEQAVMKPRRCVQRMGPQRVPANAPESRFTHFKIRGTFFDDDPPVVLLRPLALCVPESSTSTCWILIFDDRLAMIAKLGIAANWTSEISTPSTWSSTMPLCE